MWLYILCMPHLCDVPSDSTFYNCIFAVKLVDDNVVLLFSMPHPNLDLHQSLPSCFCLLQIRTRMIEMVSEGLATMEVGDLQSLLLKFSVTKSSLLIL